MNQKLRNFRSKAGAVSQAPLRWFSLSYPRRHPQIAPKMQPQIEAHFRPEKITLILSIYSKYSANILDLILDFFRLRKLTFLNYRNWLFSPPEIYLFDQLPVGHCGAILTYQICCRWVTFASSNMWLNHIYIYIYMLLDLAASGWLDVIVYIYVCMLPLGGSMFSICI